jgi:hypothetical protein
VLVQIRLKNEQEEKEHKKKEKAEAHLYTIIKVWSSFLFILASLTWQLLLIEPCAKNEHRLLMTKI